ncbi:outer membrane lipoprotein Blc precursor [mine drainage metagenome]|uniref:Outer membrane lipoprotein Blc n=1 Tax=mine drainage metagenome TaxID=410659 RepID=A0A1J5RGL4_9ZZZZ
MPAPLRIVLAGLLLIIGGSSSATAAQMAPAPLGTIPHLDVPRYMGVWYEVAKYPNRFQAGCAGETSATYSLQANGTVKVVNRCKRTGGKMDEAVGVARQIGGPTSPKLKVRFAPWWLSWVPAVWGDYWVIDLDPGYRLVAISEPRRKYLWVLSRTPTVAPAAYQALLSRLQTQGFDLAKLEITKQ